MIGLGDLQSDPKARRKIGIMFERIALVIVNHFNPFGHSLLVKEEQSPLSGLGVYNPDIFGMFFKFEVENAELGCIPDINSYGDEYFANVLEQIQPTFMSGREVEPLYVVCLPVIVVCVSG